MKLKKSIVLGMIAALSMLAINTVPAMAGSGHGFRSGASAFESSARDYGRQVVKGARNYGSRAASTARQVAPWAQGASHVNRVGKLLLKRSPLPLIIVPKGYEPGKPWPR
jgi:hypothetical protein